jgi:hypothetical protein
LAENYFEKIEIGKISAWWMYFHWSRDAGMATLLAYSWNLSNCHWKMNSGAGRNKYLCLKLFEMEISIFKNVKVDKWHYWSFLERKADLCG